PTGPDGRAAGLPLRSSSLAKLNHSQGFGRSASWFGRARATQQSPTPECHIEMECSNHSVVIRIRNLIGISAPGSWQQEMLHPRNLMVERLPEIPFLGLAGNEARPHLQAFAGAGAIHPSDHAIHPQQRHGVVAPATIAFRHIGLETIGPSPDVLEAPAIPDDRIEWREKAHLARRIGELSVEPTG